MTSPVTLLSRLRAIDPAAADVLAARLEELARRVQTEPGNLAYRVFRTHEDETTFYIQEFWAAPEDADRHLRRVESDPVAQDSATLLAAPIETATLLAVGGPASPDGDCEGDHDERTHS